MGLTQNTATVLALNGLDVLLSSAVSEPSIEVGLAGMVQTALWTNKRPPTWHASSPTGVQRGLPGY
jgi:hypothetical protein